MRKNILSLSIAAMIGGLGFAGSASANVVATTTAPIADTLVLNAGGVGHALITPYFTAQADNATVISLVNTDTANGKAVKVRFRGAVNSDDILDFQVYMSPADHWSAVVTKNAAGVAQLVTQDATCTIPQMTKGTAYPFLTGRLPSYLSATDLGNNTLEGYIEIFNMADIVPNTVTTSLFASIKHTAGVPRNCSSDAGAPLNATLTDSVGAVLAGTTFPTTGLMGNWTIINVAKTTTFSGSMTAIRATVAATGADATGNYVLFPQSDTAASTSGDVDLVTADPLFRLTNAVTTKTSTNASTNVVTARAITAAFYDLPDMSTPYLAANVGVPTTQASNLTSSLATTAISNEFTTDATLTATTDWVFSMPTRRYSVAVKYGSSATGATRLYTQNVTSGLSANAQFFSDTNTTLVNGDKLCVSANSQKFWDREEQTTSSGAVFSPGSIASFRFCGETSVTTFGASSPLGAAAGIPQTASAGFVNGWGNVQTPNTVGATNIGLPILGSAFIKLNNAAAAAGTSGTYGITSDHRFSLAR